MARLDTYPLVASIYVRVEDERAKGGGRAPMSVGGLALNRFAGGPRCGLHLWNPCLPAWVARDRLELAPFRPLTGPSQ